MKKVNNMLATAVRDIFAVMLVGAGMYGCAMLALCLLVLWMQAWQWMGETGHIFIIVSAVLALYWFGE